MNNVSAKIEAILFLSTKAVSLTKLGKLLDVEKKPLREAIDELKRQKNLDTSGVHVIEMDGSIELVSNPAFVEVLEHFKKDEVTTDLTRPQLETLTIVAYRGPITKPEIEHIRGVNCSLILRNLLMRGLVQEKTEESGLQVRYILTSDMLKHLGVHEVSELPDYAKFHENEKISQMLDAIFSDDQSIE